MPRNPGGVRLIWMSSGVGAFAGAAVIVAWFVIGASRSDVQDYVRIETVHCPAEMAAPVKVDCGTMTVPERWDHLNGPVIQVFFAVARSHGTIPEVDPLVVLHGGPGQAGTDLLPISGEQMGGILQSRDVFFVDQRGTGHSQPALYCRDLDPVAYWHGGLTADDAQDCLAQIESEGHRAESFDTLASARDVVALRQALAIDRWNLLGISYGTILALEVVRLDPDGIRSVVLNSPTRTTASWIDPMRMAAIERVYKQVFADCAADPRCTAAYPHLQRQFEELSTALSDKPIVFDYTDPRTGAVRRAEMDFAKVLNVMTILIGSGQSAAQVPRIIDHLHQVVYGQAEPWMPLVSWLYMPYWEFMDLIAYGLNAAIGCREVRPWVDAESARAAADLYQPYVTPWSLERDYDVFCPVWNLPPAPASLRTPVVSDVPALLLTGEYDTLTPTELADAVAAHLSNSRVVRFRGVGHDVYDASSCARRLTAAFLDAVDVAMPTTCAVESMPPAFVIDQATSTN